MRPDTMPPRNPGLWDSDFDHAPSVQQSRTAESGRRLDGWPPLVFLGMAAALVIIVVLVFVIRDGEDGKAFNPDDFQWPALIQMLDKGDTAHLLEGDADARAIVIYYLWRMNNYFSEQREFGAVTDPRCIAYTYKPKMTGKVLAVVGTDLVPQVFSDLDFAANSSDPVSTLAQRYPFIADLVRSIGAEVSSGNIDALISTLRTLTTYEERAKQDAAVLLFQYQCSPGSVTRRVLENAYQVMDRYSTQGPR
jgi:hypothetical protein